MPSSLCHAGHTVCRLSFSVVASHSLLQHDPPSFQRTEAAQVICLRIAEGIEGGLGGGFMGGLLERALCGADEGCTDGPLERPGEG